jgi:hypothetical protein
VIACLSIVDTWASVSYLYCLIILSKVRTLADCRWIRLLSINNDFMLFQCMCAIAKFLLYSGSIFDIVMINDKCTHLFVVLRVYYARMLGSRKYVSMVLRYNLLEDSPYTPGRVVDRGCDRPIESFAVHPSSIRLGEQ